MDRFIFLGSSRLPHQGLWATRDRSRRLKRALMTMWRLGENLGISRRCRGRECPLIMWGHMENISGNAWKLGRRLRHRSTFPANHGCRSRKSETGEQGWKTGSNHSSEMTLECFRCTLLLKLWEQRNSFYIKTDDALHFLVLICSKNFQHIQIQKIPTCAVGKAHHEMVMIVAYSGKWTFPRYVLYILYTVHILFFFFDDLFWQVCW